MDKPISVGDMVMIVRGHSCAVDLLGGVPWRVTGILPQTGGGWTCNRCEATHLASESAYGATGVPRVSAKIRKPRKEVHMPLAWLKRIPPLSELAGQPTREDMKEPA